MKQCSIVLLLFVELALSAQPTNSLILHFGSRSAKLTPVEKQKLETFLLTKDPAIHDYKVSIEGHTDNEGCLTYNQALSGARATTVKNFILEKGWSEAVMSVSFFAFNRPLANNTSDNGKQKNRRVLVVFEEVSPDRAKLLGLQTNDLKFNLRTEAAADLSYSSGTRLHIPSNAFTYKNGTPVTGTVDVHYTEYRDIGDFIASSIPMSFVNGNHELLQFNSAGMFKIEAFAGDEELVLAHGKNIDINFKRTGEVDDLGLYRFNEVANTWSLSTPAATRGTARTIFRTRPAIFTVMNYRGKDSCTLPVDAAVLMAINTGLKLSEGNSAIHYQRAGQYYSNKKVRASFPAKKLLVTSQQPAEVRFRVLHVEDKSPNGLQDFEFIYEGVKDRPFLEHWKNSFWTDVTINWLSDDAFTLFLTRNSEKVKLEVRGLYKRKRICDQTFLALVKQGKIPNMEVYDPFDTRNKKKSLGISEILINDRCTDSLFCFYTTSRRWMNAENGEADMDYKAWLDYFNAHKPEMRERYRTLKFREAGIMTQARIERERQRVNDSIWMAGEIATMETMDALQTSISVNGLGVWNCDQLFKVKDPVIVNKTYLNTGGQVVDPLLVYVIDKEVNGVLTFDGSYGMDPFNFRVGARTSNMLLALDNKQQVYLCKQEWFDTAMREGSPFLMEPLAKEKVSEVIAMHREN